eukprot:6349761-Prymnesium_polylepis.1
MQLGHTVLLTRLAAEYLALPHLPYKAVFQGSHSLIWHPSRHRAPRRVSTAPLWRTRAARLDTRHPFCRWWRWVSRGPAAIPLDCGV